MNEYLDMLLETAGPFIDEQKLDPMPLPDIVQTFEAVSFNILN